MQLNRLQALNLLAECTGDDIWSIDHCRLCRVPESWIIELRDCYESGFESDSQTIYYQDSVVNQFDGIRDVDLAVRVAQHLGVAVEDLVSISGTRRALVQAIRERIEEG